MAGLTPQRTSRWLKGYTYKISRAPDSRSGSKGPIISRHRPSKGTYVSFLELIDLLAVKELLATGFSLQRLRNLLAEVASLTGQPHFAHEDFFRMGSRLFIRAQELEESMILLLSGGQSAMPGIIEAIAHKIQFDPITRAARKWFPRGQDYPVVVDPAISYGRPSIVKRGVATAVVYDLFLGESGDLDAASAWMSIDRQEAEAAVLFETQLAA